MSPARRDDIPWSEFGTPIPVENGLKARSVRGAIGEQWWSKRFVGVLESFALGGRLTRGRAYARKGQVLSLSINTGVVAAQVQGSRPKPYRVSINLAPFNELTWARVEVALAEQARFSAQLLSGVMPPAIDDVFAAAGAPLFPTKLDDLRMSCTCPDQAVPCKHLAATFYLLAEAFDADPFQILAWRGRDKDALVARLRVLRGGEPEPASRRRPGPASKSGAPAGNVTASPAGAAFALGELHSAPLADVADRFWVAPVPLGRRPPVLDAAPDLLLRQLSPPGAEIGGRDLQEALRSAYERMGEG